MRFWTKKNKTKKYKDEVEECISKFEKEIGEEQYPDINLSKDKFPEEFIELFNLASKYGQSCDELRWYYINKSTEEELNQMVLKVKGYEQKLSVWVENRQMETN